MNPTQNSTEVTEVTPAITLRHAALYLQRYGWTQGDYYRDHWDEHGTPGLFPAACALGAIAAAVYGEAIASPEDEMLPEFDYVDDARHALGQYICPDVYDYDPSIESVGDWNDDPSRTADEVISTLNDAADYWDCLHPGRAR